jgi:hypothetical protein
LSEIFTEGDRVGCAWLPRPPALGDELMINTRRTFGIIATLVPLLAMGSMVALAQTAPASLLPLSYPVLRQLQNQPAALRELQTRPTAPVQAPAPAAAPLVAGPWQLTNNPFPGTGSPANPLLLTDGTVIVHLIGPPPAFAGTESWYQLTPDINGSYVNGTWSTFASPPSGYGPLFHASEVLPDGRVIINGGEYNLGVADDTNLGAIYYPNFGAWTKVAPPAFFVDASSDQMRIGDASSVVLNNGTYMLSDCCDSPSQTALFDATPPFTSANWTFTGSGKANNSYNEEGWTVLPNGNVLTVDVVGCTAVNGRNNTEIYSAISGTWSSAGTTNTVVPLSDCGQNPVANAYEMGPQVLRPDGTLLAFGGVNEGTDPIAIFDTSTSTWAAGPNVPSVSSVPYTLADAPAAMLPSGNVLFAASPSNWPVGIPPNYPGWYPNPTNFWEVGPNSGGNVITPIMQNPDGPSTSSFQWNFLLLPNGQVLAVAAEFNPDVWIYTPLPGAPDPAGRRSSIRRRRT